jgi:hypothetical protein
LLSAPGVKERQARGADVVNTAILLKLSALAAVLGGILRMAAALPLGLDAVAAEALYDAIDVLLLMGLMGIYLSRAEALGVLGLTAFALATAALSFIGGPDADPFGFSTYQEGAVVLALAMAGLSIAWVRAMQRPIAPALLWFLSVLVPGVLGMLPPPLPNYGMQAAGVLFGAGFAAAGHGMLRDAMKP